MFIIRGVNVFPSQIEAALLAVEGTLPHYQIVLTREKGLDEMEVQVEVTAGGLQRHRSARWRTCSTSSASAIDHTARHPRQRHAWSSPHTIQRSEGKAKRVIDQRKI